MERLRSCLRERRVLYERVIYLERGDSLGRSVYRRVGRVLFLLSVRYYSTFVAAKAQRFIRSCFLFFWENRQHLSIYKNVAISNVER